LVALTQRRDDSMNSAKLYLKTLLFAGLMLILPCNTGLAQNSKIVGIIPFAMHGVKNPRAVQEAFINIILQSLADMNVSAVPYPNSAKISSDDQAREIARNKNWRYALWGSITEIGNVFSVDSRLVSINEGEETAVFYAEAPGIKKLAVAITEIAEKVASKVNQQQRIAEIRIEGNERIGDDAILAQIKSSVGSILNPKAVRQDIRAIYNMGYFEDIRVEAKDSPQGKILIFYVKENPIVQAIEIKGNRHIDSKDILAAIQTKTYSVLKRKQLAQDVQSILDLYHQKAYFDASVDYFVDFPRDPRKARVTFRIKEGNKFYVKKITFKGNKAFSDRRLRMVMQTKTKNILFFWQSERGVLQKDVLDTDVDRLTVFYHNHGYMDAKVGTPKIEKRKDGFYIEIPILEGERYKVASFEVAGDKVEGIEKFQEQWKTKVGKFFSRSKVREDTETLTRFCMDQGYAHAEVQPRIRKNTETHEAYIMLNVKLGPKVTIGRIDIEGNTKTRDKVIRGQLQITEGDTFSATKIENSQMKLKRLDYFEEVSIEPQPGETPEVMNLKIKVKEKLTGSISAGGGFSSDEGLFVGGEIIQRNLFGRGQAMALRAHLGADAQRYSLSFTEPSLFDTYYYLGLDAYNWLREYEDFTKDSQGFQIRTGRFFGNWSRFGVGYTFESARIKDIDENAASIIKEQEGRQIKSSITFSFRRDSTDNAFLPTRGSINRVSVEFASDFLGSDSCFTKYQVISGWYIPLLWKLTGFVKGELGWINKTGDNPIPLFDRFFLGGINSVRSYDWGELGPKDPETGDTIGGTKYGLFTSELIFPIFEEIKLHGVVFFDAGNAFDEGEDLDVSKFKMGIGGGIRWVSPLGPLRIEWAYNPDPDPGDSRSKWQFSMGASF